MNELTPSRKRYRGQWPKGVSGNYRGRPKIDPNLRRLAQEHSEGALYRLVEITKNSSAYSPREQSIATTLLLNLAWGGCRGIKGHYLKEIGMTFAQYLHTPFEASHESLVQAKIAREKKRKEQFSIANTKIEPPIAMTSAAKTEDLTADL